MHPSLLVAVVLALMLSGCASSGWLSPESAALLRNPPPQTVAKIRAVTPAALRWYGDVEARYWPLGLPLSDKYRAFARRVGIGDPEKVRVLGVSTFPLPADPALRRLARKLDFASVYTRARTFGHVILTQPGFETDDRTITHELVHIAQFERLGRDRIIPRLLLELDLLGYSSAPLENEAYRLEREGL